MPLAIALMAGGFEFGRAIFNYHSVDKSLRNAARYLARVPNDSGGVAGWGLTRARHLALYGTTDTTDTSRPILSSWTDPNTIQLTFPGPSAPPDTVRLTATVPFTFALLPAIGRSNQITITVSHQERWISE